MQRTVHHQTREKAQEKEVTMKAMEQVMRSVLSHLTSVEMEKEKKEVQR